jgi:hypothetical protein
MPYHRVIIDEITTEKSRNAEKHILSATAPDTIVAAVLQKLPERKILLPVEHLPNLMSHILPYKGFPPLDYCPNPITKIPLSLLWITIAKHNGKTYSPKTD